MALILHINFVILVLGLLPAIAIGMTSFMMFGAPGSEKNQKLWVFFWVLLSFPVIIVISLFLAWLLHNQGFDAVATLISCLPYFHIAAIFLANKKLYE